MRRRRIVLGTGTLVVMLVLLAVYAVVHSPLRRPIWDALFGDCDFLCNIPSPRSAGFQAASALWLVFVAGAGALAIAQRAVTGRLERVVAWGLVAYGLLVIPAALVAFAGDRLGVALLRPPVGPVLASLPALACLAWSWRTGWRPSVPRLDALPRATPLVVLLVLLVVAGQALQVGLAAQVPPASFDDLGYHGPLAVLLWGDGSLETFLDRILATPVLSHPGGAELWQGLLLLVGGEPLAVGGQLPFAWLGAAGVALFARRLGLGRGAAVVGALLFLSAPMVMEQIGHIRNDVVGAALTAMTAALLAARWDDRMPARLALAGLGLGLMAVTKLALMPAIAAGAILMAWLLVREWRSGRDMRPLWGAVGVGALLAGLAVAPWWLRNVMHDGNPLFPADLPIIGGGIPWRSPPDIRYIPDRLLWPLYPLLERFGVADGLGGAFAVGILPALAGAAFVARRRPLVVLVVLVLVTLPAWWLLDRREPRFLLGLAALLFALIPFGLVVLRARWRQAGAAILGVAALVTAGAQLAITDRPVMVERSAFYDRVGVDPAAVTLPERDGILLDDRCGSAGANRLYPFFGAGRARRVARVDCDGWTTERIERELRRERLTHVYLVVEVEDAAARAAIYPAERFELVSRSTWQPDADSKVLQRSLYRWLGGRGGGRARRVTPGPRAAWDVLRPCARRAPARRTPRP